MIITTDNQTITRMAVIANRTDSEFMVGAKAMMVESLKRQMRGGVAHFVYQKKNGELREAVTAANFTAPPPTLMWKGVHGGRSVGRI